MGAKPRDVQFGTWQTSSTLSVWWTLATHVQKLDLGRHHQPKAKQQLMQDQSSSTGTILLVTSLFPSSLPSCNQVSSDPYDSSIRICPQPTFPNVSIAPHCLHSFPPLRPLHDRVARPYFVERVTKLCLSLSRGPGAQFSCFCLERSSNTQQLSPHLVLSAVHSRETAPLPPLRAFCSSHHPCPQHPAPRFLSHHFSTKPQLLTPCSECPCTLPLNGSSPSSPPDRL